ncbi:MAG: trypsin-like peptidase domain-containing protein [Rhizobacter sp.]|nr:trypsin-like peptidase domain-containing protein [Rhizobacter sp.]
MKRVVAIAFALALGLFAVAPGRAEFDRAVLVSLAASVLKIEALRVQGGFSLGSGVVVAPDTVVTNCHVTHDALKINVLHGGARWLVESQLSHVERDLCLLRVPGLRASAVTLGRSDGLRPGQPVTALGYTGGAELRNSPGLVLAMHRFDGSRVIQSSSGFSSGASGGGLFDESLHLVGILTFRLRGGEAHYFAAPVEWLQTLLERPDALGYNAVAPDRSQRLAYWQRPSLDQPRFLKAALLQRNDQWPELEALAAEWTRADAYDPEPWYLSGLALTGMNRLPEAQRALACSLAIEQTPPAMPSASPTPTATAGTPCAPGAPSPQSP